MKIKLYEKTLYPFDDGTDVMWTMFDSLETLDEFLHPSSYSIWDHPEDFEAAYEKWESSWIDGIQP